MIVCKYYDLFVKQLDLLFNSLIGGCAYYSKCINQIDKLIDKIDNLAYRYGYISGRALIKEIINKER